jgi:hypothetical protein
MCSVTHMGVVGLRTLRPLFLRKGEVGTRDEHGRRYCDPGVARRCVETGVRATKTGALGLLRSGLGRSIVRDGASNRKLIEYVRGGRLTSNTANRA